jgi:hypothetical protein
VTPRVPHERSAEDRRLDAERDAVARLCIAGGFLVVAALWLYTELFG